MGVARKVFRGNQSGAIHSSMFVAAADGPSNCDW
jgi:hypothetical protein